ncbi:MULTISPECIES: hypothetical protein [unclassified Streptomyces]|uniref:hypothetical protein n=1 Tax=unclassified Streptomyces TaxID=2593676 RepID=UPI002E19B663|nr:MULTISPECIES: hypothetical protein [unclassified Streptomyces]
MTSRTWLITGVNSGFGHALSSRLLERGNRATVRRELAMSGRASSSCSRTLRATVSS